MTPAPTPAPNYFVRVGDRLVLSTRITSIDARRLEHEGVIEVHIDGEPSPSLVSGSEAIDLVMREAPSFFEGRRFAWVRSAWALHNLVGHPLMQGFAWIGKLKIGLWIHDVTIPRPRSRSRSHSSQTLRDRFTSRARASRDH